jgi:hypothetical protein
MRRDDAMLEPQHGTRSPAQHFPPQQQQPPSLSYAPHARMHEEESSGAYPNPGGMATGPPPAMQWYEPPYAESETQPWATMDLNTGAVMSNGMEAYMIPVG